MELSLMGFKGWWSGLVTSCRGTTKPNLESIFEREKSLLKCICVLTSCE